MSASVEGARQSRTHSSRALYEVTTLLLFYYSIMFPLTNLAFAYKKFSALKSQMWKVPSPHKIIDYIRKNIYFYETYQVSRSYIFKDQSNIR